MGPLLDQTTEKQNFMALINSFNDKNARINKEKIVNTAETVAQLLESISQFSVPFKFRLADNNNLINIVIGEVGTGKSTLQNNLMQRYCKRNDLKRPRNFKQMASPRQVTKFAEIRESPDSCFITIDMPSASDSVQSPLKDGIQLTNEVVSKILVNTMREDFIYSPHTGLSTVTHCIMIEKGLRIQASSLHPIANIMLSFTMSYPDFKTDYSPIINVVFTGFSIHQNQTLDGYGDEDDSEDEYGSETEISSP